MIYRKGRELSATYLVGRAVLYIYHKGRLAWEWITAFIFTMDGFGVQTKDGYIIKCKDQ